MTFPQAISNGFRCFMSTTGRASRSEFWYWYLFVAILSMIVGICTVMAGENDSIVASFEKLFSIIFSVSVLCAGIRRLHDIGKSGWNVCWALIPIVGGIYLIVLYCRASDPYDNKYGPGEYGAPNEYEDY